MPCNMEPYSGTISSWKECGDAVRALVGVKEAKVSPSMTFGRSYPRGCYYFPKRHKQGLDAVYWNEVEGMKTSFKGVAARAVCKHTTAATTLSEIVTQSGSEALKDKIPASKITRSANISHILVTDEDEVRLIMEEITKAKKSFAEAGEKYSVSNKETGQHLGMVYEGTLEPELNDAIFWGRADAALAGPALSKDQDAVAMFGGMRTRSGYHVVLVHTVDKSLKLTEEEIANEALNDDIALNGVYITYGLSRPAMKRQQERELEL
eukprot:TRINITY_DN47270_c0_g1_i1.p1 TRINITY_DN47270_c0_g1~~TRINITY_DN47270_c0_g1_i1.p1  ORF type:complete len:307 (+),score=66.92 TRINITY_DN47270_c0_g1_i1:129-923(+)